MVYLLVLDLMEVVICRAIEPSPYFVGWGQPFSKRDMELVPCCPVFVPEVEPYLPISPSWNFLGKLVCGPWCSAAWIEGKLLQILPISCCHVREKYYLSVSSTSAETLYCICVKVLSKQYLHDYLIPLPGKRNWFALHVQVDIEIMKWSQQHLDPGKWC